MTNVVTGRYVGQTPNGANRTTTEGHDMNRTTTTTTVLVIPCGAAKLTEAAPARDLYTGSMFRHQLAAAAESFGPEGGTILVLSALHGLVSLDTVLAPYNVKMGDRGSVTASTVAAQAMDLGIEWGTEVFTLLPKAYRVLLDEALRTLDVFAQDIYEASPGIGYQRGTCSSILRTAA